MSSLLPDLGKDAVLYRKVALRLIPILFVCYIMAFIDRVNVGFAKLAMKEETWFSDAVFATGAGIFFLGYFFFEVPGNVILHRVGARLWITRIMVCWGVVSGLVATSDSATAFYFWRFLLGVAEAGFFPGIILYLTYWFPREQRARMSAWFMTAIAISGVIGSPISGWLLDVSTDWPSMKPWQWLFVVEAIPTVIIGCMVPFLLVDKPAKAKWLTDAEKATLQSRLDAEEAKKKAEGHQAHRLTDAFKSPRVWLYCAIYFGLMAGLYGTSFWLQQIIKDNLIPKENLTTANWHIGLYSSIPWACAAVSMVLVGRHSDRTGERHWHAGISSLIGAAAFAASGIPGMPPYAILALMAVAISGVMCTMACFWAMPAAVLSGTAAAAGIAWINSCGNLAGYFSPEMVAWLKVHHSMGTALCGVAVLLASSGILSLISAPKRVQNARSHPSSSS